MGCVGSEKRKGIRDIEAVTEQGMCRMIRPDLEPVLKTKQPGPWVGNPFPTLRRSTQPMGEKLGPWVGNPFPTRSRYVMMTFQTGFYSFA